MRRVEDGDNGAGEVGGKYHRYEAKGVGEAGADQNENPLHSHHY